MTSNTAGNSIPLTLNLLKDLGVEIAINFHHGLCVVPVVDILFTMDMISNYFFHTSTKNVPLRGTLYRWNYIIHTQKNLFLSNSLIYLK